MMRWITPLLIALIVLLQYPLWFGEGGWLKLWDLGGEVASQQELNGKLRVRNETISAEVRDLKEARDAIEERARGELGMIRSDEVFVRVVPGEAGREPDSRQ
jgi:cell division protein FtsB